MLLDQPDPLVLFVGLLEPLEPCVVLLLVPLLLCPLADPLVFEVPFAVEIFGWKQCSPRPIINRLANASVNWRNTNEFKYTIC